MVNVHVWSVDDIDFAGDELQKSERAFHFEVLFGLVQKVGNPTIFVGV